MTNQAETTTDLETQLIALDAAEEGRIGEANAIAVGTPVTMSIRSDSYGAVVVRVTRTTITADDALYPGNPRTFRRRKSDGAWYARGWFLRLGEAVDHRDPSF